MKIHLLSRPALAAASLLAASQMWLQAQDNTFSPIALTPGSYGYKMVLPAGAPLGMPTSTSIKGCVNAFVGSGITYGDSTFYEQTLYNFNPSGPGYNSGCPHPGQTFQSVNTAAGSATSNMVFQMPPSYNQPDDMFIANSTTYGIFNSGTLTFVTPTTATNLAVLCTGGNGGCTVTYTVNHSDSTTDTGTIVVPDWFSGGSNMVWGNNGRIDTGGFENYNSSPTNNNPPYFYGVQLPITNAATITSIDFNYVSGGGIDSFFGVSGEANGVWTPIPLSWPSSQTGSYYQTLVPATGTPFPITATMDNGTNVLEGGTAAGNTWFEQGWYPTVPTDGLPPSGSSFISAANPNITYQLANYSNNCAVMISSNQNTASIIPASLTNTYAALSFLTSMGNGPGVNAAIVQHADGVNETNDYNIYDWFQGAPPYPAWTAHGRVTMNARLLENIGDSSDPNLFDAVIYLADRTSPVTNIIINWVSGTGHTCLLAVSGVPGNALAPVITTQPLPSAVLSGSNVTFTVSAFGFQPLTYQWYGPINGGFSPPAGLIAGATNTSLTVTATGASAGQYYVIVTDGNGLTTVNASPNGSQGGAFLNVITSPLAGNYFSSIIGLNPIGYWPLNEKVAPQPYPAIATNSGTLGASGNAVYSGEIAFGAASPLADGEGASVTGNGDETQIVLPYQSALSSVPLTFEGWFNPASGFNNGGEVLASDGEPFAVNYTGFWLNAGTSIAGNGTGNINLLTYYAAGNHAAANINVTNIPPNAWTYVAVTIAPNPGSNSPTTGYLTTLYIDGTNAGSAASAFVPNADAPFKIGNRSDDPGYGSWNFAGQMSEVAFYNTALSASTIAAHYAAGINPSPATPYITTISNANPLLYYTLSEPTPTYPAIDQGPIATNYGGTGATDNGVYLAGTFPGAVAGPHVAQFPANDVAPSFNHIYWYPGGPTTAGIFNATTDAGNTGLMGYVDVPLDSFNALEDLGAVTVAAWVQATPNNGNRFSTILGKGDPSYRFDMDGTASPPPPQDLIHWAYGGSSEGDVVGTGLEGSLIDGQWHFIVGTWDGVSNQYLYVDGVSNSGSISTSKPNGDLYDFVIGEAPDDTGRAFDGNIAEVAIFPKALTAAQVASLYNIAQVAAEIIEEPVASQIIGAGTTASISAVAIGDGTLGYQWYDNGSPVSGSEYSGGSTAALTITGASTADSGTYTLVVTNVYGAVTSTPSVLTVLNTPVVTTYFPTFIDTLQGSTVDLPVSVTSQTPVTSAWYDNGVLVTNGNGISGATATNLLILSATAANNGTYQYFGTNANGVGVSGFVAVTVFPVSEPSFFSYTTFSNYWTIDSSGTSTGQGQLVTNNVLELTDYNNSEYTAAFFDAPVYIGSFQASWEYIDAQVTAGTTNAQNATADGFTFCIANNPKGASALGTENGGAGGSGLGYTGISNSVALACELYNNGDNAPGIAFQTNGIGSAGAGNTNPNYIGYDYGHVTPVNIESGDPILFKIKYDGNNLNISLTDESNGMSFETNWVVGSIPAYVGDSTTALIGFTGATGGVNALQYIENFEFTPDPVVSATLSAGNLVLTWPVGPGLGGFTLETASSLTGPWTPVSTPVSVVNGAYQVTVTPGTGNHFYQLVAPLP